jgi:hypothetical protein
MRSEIVGSSGERPTVNKAVGGFSVFLANRISHSMLYLRISSIKLRFATCTYIQAVQGERRAGSGCRGRSGFGIGAGVGGGIGAGIMLRWLCTFLLLIRSRVAGLRATVDSRSVSVGELGSVRSPDIDTRRERRLRG